MTFAIIYITAAASYTVVVETVRGQIEKGQGLNYLSVDERFNKEKVYV